MAKSDEQVAQEFDEAVNMSREELAEWLGTDESKEVGQKDGGSESKAMSRAARSLRSSKRASPSTPRRTSSI
jgi:hypothetical protein